LRKARAGISQQMERLTEAYLIAIIPLAEYQRRRSELKKQLCPHLEPGAAELSALLTTRAERFESSFRLPGRLSKTAPL